MQRKEERNASECPPGMPEKLYRIRQTGFASQCQISSEINIAQNNLFHQIRLLRFTFLFFLLHGGTAQATFHDVANSSARIEVKIGVILTQISGKSNFTDILFSMEATLPAIKLAVEKIESNYYPILPGVRFVIHEADSNCSSFEGPLAAVDMYYAKQAHVYLGPACMYAISPVARYSGVWGIPVVTAGALYDSFKNKTEFKTLTRVQSSLNNVMDAFLTTLDHFNWARIGIMYCENTERLGVAECLHILRPIFDSFPRPPQYTTLTSTNMTTWMEQIADMSKGSRSE